MRKKRGGVIAEKSKEFAIASLQFGRKIQREKKEFVATNQWMRSSASIGANVRESQHAESRRDFIHKLAIAQKECEESLYWLDLLLQCNLINEDDYNFFEGRAKELAKILTSILKTSKKRFHY